jgi:hypothetical protein
MGDAEMTAQGKDQPRSRRDACAPSGRKPAKEIYVAVIVILIFLLFISMHFLMLYRYPLHIAAAMDNIYLVKTALLFDRGSINKRSFGGINTAIHYAVKKKNHKIARLLLDSGADPNMMDHDVCYYPLHFAIMMDDKEMIKILLDNGADPDLRIRNYRETSEEFAIKLNRPAMAQQILNWKQQHGNWWFYGKTKDEL